MKIKLLLSAILASSFTFAQSWNLTGNAGINPVTNFLGTTDAQDVVIKTNNMQRMKIHSTGGVGIGVEPDSRLALKVNGIANFIADVNSDAFYIGNHSSNVDNGNSLLFLRYGQYQPANPGVIDVAGWPTPNKYELYFSLKSNGKLFLGTSANQSCGDCNDYRLFVKDGIKAEKVKVDVASTNGWADYVFKKDYKLNSLEEIEKHIKEKGHLPNIPSAEEVVKNGINLGEMDAKLLEKIEELTLYSIEQNKALKSQSEEIEELKRQVQQLLSSKK
jgi:polyhydroxyalkanoate synthesis regulator phasin